MKYKLVISDVDETLVDRNKNISKRTKNLIKEFQDSGGVFTLATGRIEDSARRYYEELNIYLPAILYNGAKIVDLDKGQCLFEQRVELVHAQEALRIAENYPFDTLVYHQGKAYVSEVNDVIKEYMVKDGINCVAVGNLHEYLKEEPTKILLIGDRENFAYFQDEFLKKCDRAPSIVNSEPTYLEILPIGISKGHALKKLVDMLDISIDEVVAIGDNLNDIELIQYAGLGIAVANAHPDLIRVADYVTKSNEEEGVAEVLQKLLKGEL